MVAERRPQERPLTVADLSPLERAIADLVRVAILEERRQRATLTVIDGGRRMRTP